MSEIHRIRELVKELSRLLDVEVHPTVPVDRNELRSEMIARQPIPTVGQLRQLEAIERGKVVSDRNLDVRRISWLGYVGRNPDGTLLLSPIGRAMLEKYRDQKQLRS